MGQFRWAPDVYRQLRGLLCVYKPAGLPMSNMLEIIKHNLARDLNELPCYEVESQLRKHDPEADLRALPMVTDNGSTPMLTDDMLEHRLILGQRFEPSDIGLRHIHGLKRHSSGVVLVGMGRCRSIIDDLSFSRYMRVYHVKGRFGWASSNFSPKGKIVERTTYRHIQKVRLNKVLASIQSSHQKMMFQYAGVDLHSQAAFRLAEQGLVRPKDNHTPPMIYSIRCIDMELPDFTLEIHSINEYCEYFMEMVHDIGLQLKSTAVCTGVRRLRYGHFDTTHALVRPQWTLTDVVGNLLQNVDMMTPDRLAGEGTLMKIVGEEGEKKLIEG